MSLTKDIGLGILAASITLSSVGCKEKNIEKEETKQTEQSEEKKETINSDSSEQIMVGEIELTKSIKKGYTENKIKCRGTNIVIPDEMYAQFIAEKLSADEFCSNYLKNKNEKKFVRATKPNSLEKKLFTSIEPITLDVVITDVQSDQIPYRNEQGPSPVTGLLGIKYVIAKSYGEELVFIYPKRGAVIKGNATVKYRELKNKAIINAIINVPNQLI